MGLHRSPDGWPGATSAKVSYHLTLFIYKIKDLNKELLNQDKNQNNLGSSLETLILKYILVVVAQSLSRLRLLATP